MKLFKLSVITVSVLSLAGCISAPTSPDTSYKVSMSPAYVDLLIEKSKAEERARVMAELASQNRGDKRFSDIKIRQLESKMAQSADIRSEGIAAENNMTYEDWEAEQARKKAEVEAERTRAEKARLVQAQAEMDRQADDASSAMERSSMAKQEAAREEQQIRARAEAMALMHQEGQAPARNNGSIKLNSSEAEQARIAAAEARMQRAESEQTEKEQDGIDLAQSQAAEERMRQAEAEQAKAEHALADTQIDEPAQEPDTRNYSVMPATRTYSLASGVRTSSAYSSGGQSSSQASRYGESQAPTKKRTYSVMGNSPSVPSYNSSKTTTSVATDQTASPRSTYNAAASTEATSTAPTPPVTAYVDQAPIITAEESSIDIERLNKIRLALNKPALQGAEQNSSILDSSITTPIKQCNTFQQLPDYYHGDIQAVSKGTGEKRGNAMKLPSLCKSSLTPEVVLHLQQALSDNGYLKPSPPNDLEVVDGIWGVNTLNSLIDYQKAYGLAYGKVSIESLEHLEVIPKGTATKASIESEDIAKEVPSISALDPIVVRTPAPGKVINQAPKSEGPISMEGLRRCSVNQVIPVDYKGSLEAVFADPNYGAGHIQKLPTLCKSSRSAKVIGRLQKALYDQGFLKPFREGGEIIIDGIWGTNTLNAVREYQKANNLAYGQLSIEVLQRLNVLQKD
ncbi:MAG: hypothetical protein ISEC1_P1268 [Thiomicrorhabdus sp.]|nr:MAG: hypothetical protein ISEC1_P1268 [Thiomicrorhabdus sp.]